MKKILLTKGYSTIVDYEDYEWLSQWSWYFHPEGRAVRSEYLEGGRKSPKYKTIYMHREILKAPKGFMVDHIDCNPLNNQKFNLRLTLPEGNSRNRGLGVNNTSGYKGVHYRIDLNKWCSRISYQKKKIFLGYFYTPLEAAIAYNNAAKLYHGEFCKLNEIRKNA